MSEQQEDRQAELVDAVDEMVEAWRAFQTAYEDFRYLQDRTRPTEGRSWAAYHDPQVQGTEKGWLGGPFLCDVIEQVGQSVG